MNENKTAPIVLFVYNRLWHTKETISFLQKNHLASESKLIIYSDAAKTSHDEESVGEVRSYLRTVNGFFSVEVRERSENWGLAKSIISGVSEVVGKYGKIIVLEDDMVTGSNFLTFMNQALEFYESKKNVWHISGWNYPISNKGSDDTFLWRGMSCWGWATWEDCWKHFEKDTDALIEEFTPELIDYMDLGGVKNSWIQVLLNKRKKINTWAVYWYATIIRNKGLCLNPVETYVSNIGLDGSGVHCGETDFMSTEVLEREFSVNWDDSGVENKEIVNKIKKYYRDSKKSFLFRVVRKLKKVLKIN